MRGITSRLQKRNRLSYFSERRLFLFFGGTSSSRDVKPALWNSVPATSLELIKLPRHSQAQTRALNIFVLLLPHIPKVAELERRGISLSGATLKTNYVFA
jgi:hypothetical protein